MYWQVRNHDFLDYDDLDYISTNPMVAKGFSADGLKWAFTESHKRFGMWVPFTWLSLMANAELFGMHPQSYLMTNVLIHILNSYLLYLVAFRMTQKRWQALFLSALFALHPMRVESVAWAVERKDVLSTFFWILALITYYQYTRNGSKRWYIGILILFICGFMCKPMVVTLPFVLLLLDYWPLNRYSTQQSVGRNHTLLNPPIKVAFIQWDRLFSLFKEKWLLIIAAGIMCWANINMHAAGIISTERLPLVSRLANALNSYAQYLKKAIWPMDLALFYPHRGEDAAVWSSLGALILMVAIAMAILFYARRHKFLLTGWFLFIGTLIPVIGIVQVGEQTMADRFTCSPYTGLFIIFAWGAPVFLSGIKYREIVLTVGSITVMAILSYLTYQQTG